MDKNDGNCNVVLFAELLMTLGATSPHNTPIYVRNGDIMARCKH